MKVLVETIKLAVVFTIIMYGILTIAIAIAATLISPQDQF